MALESRRRALLSLAGPADSRPTPTLCYLASLASSGSDGSQRHSPLPVTKGSTIAKWGASSGSASRACGLQVLGVLGGVKQPEQHSNTAAGCRQAISLQMNTLFSTRANGLAGCCTKGALTAIVCYVSLAAWRGPPSVLQVNTALRCFRP